jgi:ribonuclease P protein component
MRHGRRVQAGPIDVFYATSPADRARVGVIVPLHRRSIVERNRLKRRLREIVRQEWLPRASRHGVCLDVILRARPAAYERSFPTLSGGLRETFVSLC